MIGLCQCYPGEVDMKVPTCKREVAVSVRSPPRDPREVGKAVLADRREEAGRDKREIERANTIVRTYGIDNC